MLESIEVKKKKDSFIFNPFLEPEHAAKSPVLVAGEEAAPQIRLQNLFDFDVSLENITLNSDGIPLDLSSSTRNTRSVSDVLNLTKGKSIPIMAITTAINPTMFRRRSC